MKRMGWIVILLILAVGLFAALFVGQSTGDPATHGGVRTDKTDPDAPKAIHSTEIISFVCAFSTTQEREAGTLGRRFYTFEAAIQNGVVTGRYHSAVKSDPGETVAAVFEADAAFMAELHDLVTELDLAKYNGLSYRVSGLPPQLGADLTVTYASGEQICARNNQTNFLTREEMEALEALFHEAALGQE